MKKICFLLGLCFAMPCSSFAQWTTVCGSGNGMVVNMSTYNDDVYATGFFTSICGEGAKHIARWDGSSWHAVDTGLGNAGHKIAVLDDGMYVAQYRQAVDSNWVLKWDGAHFAKQGQGVYLTTAVVGGSKTPNIYDIVRYRGKVVACGEFDVAGNRPVRGIMQWTGTEWDSVGTGLAGAMGSSGVIYPHQMLVIDTSLYVVGNFATAGGITVNGVARWDGHSWHAMGAGFNGTVYCIAEVNGSLYAGGDLTSSGVVPLKRVARWDGSNWVDPGFGVSYNSSMMYAYVHTIKQIGTRGVLEGGFDRVVVGTATYRARSVMAFAGGGVDTLAGGIPNGEFEGLLPYDDTDILVGGATFTGSGATTHVARYHFAPVSINEVIKSNEVIVSPMPFNDVLIIQHSSKGIALIMDMAGRQISRHQLHEGRTSIDLGHLPAGVYILRVNDTDGNVISKKIVRS